MKKTQRTFENVETGRVFNLYMDSLTHEYALIYEQSKGGEDFANGTEVNGFYIAAHTGITIRLNNKKEIKLNSGQFYNLKEGEKVTHKKYLGFKRFTKA